VATFFFFSAAVAAAAPAAGVAGVSVFVINTTQHSRLTTALFTGT